MNRQKEKKETGKPVIFAKPVKQKPLNVLKGIAASTVNPHKVLLLQQYRNT